MKILQVTPEFHPSTGYGGGPIIAYEISRALVQRGHEVTVYTTDADNKTSRLNSGIKNIGNMKIYYFKNISNSMAYKLKLFVSPGMMRIISREIHNFDLIHVHDYRTFQNILVHHYAIKHGIPYVLQAHGSISSSFYQKQKQKKIFDEIFGYDILRDASKVIALTSMEALQYKKKCVDEDRIEIVPNGINLLEFGDLPESGVFRRKYSIRDDEKVILYLGRLHRTKGIDLLVKAFLDISKEIDNIRLVLVGPDDGYQSALKNLTQELKLDEKVLFSGFVTNDEKMKAFVDADVFVTPSFSGFPVTFLEACACGLPIITTNNGDKLDWIHGKVGYVVEYDKDQLREAIFRILSDGELMRKFGERGRKLVREYFSWDTIIKKIEGLYENCIKGEAK